MKLYKEEGAHVLVEVLSVSESKTDPGMVTTNLRVVQTLHPGNGLVQLIDGEDFDVCCRNGYEAYCGWTLTDPEPAQ